MGWTVDEARDYLRTIKPILKKAGYYGEIVGGVHNNRYSSHDLDIVLTPATEEFRGDILQDELGGEFTMDMETMEVRSPDGKLVDFHFKESNDSPVQMCEWCTDEFVPHHTDQKYCKPSHFGHDKTLRRAMRLGRDIDDILETRSKVRQEVGQRKVRKAGVRERHMLSARSLR